MLANTTTIGPQTQTHADKMFDAVFEHSGQFRIEMPYEEACQFIHRIEEYNEFESGSVLDALDNIDRLIPRKFYGEGNPNNGERAYSIALGREGSPVIYLELYEWDGVDRLSNERMKLICQEMELNGRADEADCDVRPTIGPESRKITFRFWWD
jgi:hypothetical protein